MSTFPTGAAFDRVVGVGGLLEGEPLQRQPCGCSHREVAVRSRRDDLRDRRYVDAVGGGAKDLVGSAGGAVVDDVVSPTARASSAFSSPLTIAITRAPPNAASWIGYAARCWRWWVPGCGW